MILARIFFPVFLIAVLSSCSGSDGTGDPAGSGAVLEKSSYILVMSGVNDDYVYFMHKEHADRHQGVCFTCHYCRPINTESHWHCESCHSPEDAEKFCNLTDPYHGCTYTQCIECHQGIDNPQGSPPTTLNPCSQVGCHAPI